MDDPDDRGPLSRLEPNRLDHLLAEHRAMFGSAPTLLAVAPGRINLIGEHTDYNEGFVLPTAIDRQAALLATIRGGRRLRLRSLNLGEPVELALDHLQPRGQWSDYVAGVANALEAAGYRLRGLDATLDSSVPLGAGLSSSAALVVAAALALARTADQGVPRETLARLCQQAEHDFVGAQVGIMDPFISLFGQPDHALRLDFRSLAHELVPLAASDLAWVVCDSGIKHELAGSEYNRRRQECAAAVAILQARYPDRPIHSLRDVTPALLDAAHSAFGPEQRTLYRRARHVVSENAHVLETADAIRAGDWPAVGRNLIASHASLRDDYQVSIPEIDALVELALGTGGVLGSRLMGGGFGGSTLTLLRRDALDRFTTAIGTGYPLQPSASIYPVAIADGARVVSLG